MYLGEDDGQEILVHICFWSILLAIDAVLITDASTDRYVGSMFVNMSDPILNSPNLASSLANHRWTLPGIFFYFISFTTL